MSASLDDGGGARAPGAAGRDQPRSIDETAARLRDVLDQIDRSGLRRTDASDIDALGRLYRAVSTYLSHHRGFGGSARREQALNSLVRRAHAVLYQSVADQPWPLRLATFLIRIPGCVRATLPEQAVALGVLLLGAVYGYVGAVEDPDWTRSFVFEGDQRTAYATRDELLESLRSGRDQGAAEKTMFASMLWQHNTRVALLAFFSGFAFGLPTLYLLLSTGLMLGTYTYTFTSHGLATEWWAWILPHGVTELLAIVLLAGGGLAVGRRLIAPGSLDRRDALRQLRPAVMSLVICAFPMLLLAAVLESYLRQSTLSDSTRLIVGGVSAGLWIVVLGLLGPPVRLGRAAVRPEVEDAPESEAVDRVLPLPFGLRSKG